MFEFLAPTSVSFELNKPWSFGSHALLSDHDRVFMTRMLECQKCRLRQVYHSLVARELSKFPTFDCWVPLKPRHHFHQLSRLIRAILIAYKRQKTLYRSGGSLCICIPPLRGMLPSRPPRVRRWVCQCHANDLFHYILYAADDDIYGLHLSEVSSSKSAKWVGDFFPKGQSELYRKSISDFEKASCVSQFKTSVTYPNFLLARDDFAPSSCGLKLVIANDLSTTSGRYLSDVDIEDANRRWNEGYKDLSPVKHVYKGGKRVRFPKFSPVTRVHHLITYETACRHVREDRTWEFCMLDRIRSGESENDNDDEEEVEDLEDSTAVATESSTIVAAAKASKDQTSICFEAELEISSHIVTEICPVAIANDPGRRRRRRNRRRRCKNKPRSPRISSVSIASDLLQNISSTSFQVETSYFQQISSLLFSNLYSASKHEPNSPVGLIDEFCVSEVSQSS